MNYLYELYGSEGVGKTHAAHDGFPNPVHLDTAFTKFMGFGEFDVESDPDERGESWSTIYKLCDWDEENAEDRYVYVDEFDVFYNFYKSGLLDDYDTIVIDNSSDMKTLAAIHWCEENDQNWPRKEQWGQINNKVVEVLGMYVQTHNVVLISQMKDEYVDGEATGERVPDGPDLRHKADFRIELVVEGDERKAKFRKNRWLDQASDEWVDEITGDLTHDAVCETANIPEKER